MIPVIIENLIEQVSNSNMNVYQRQAYATTLREIVDKSNKALQKYDADFKLSANNRRRKTA